MKSSVCIPNCLKTSNKKDTPAEHFQQEYHNTKTKLYLATYCSMCSDLNSKLQSFRLSHLSHTALEQFKKVELENLQDGFGGYDLLITNFDFDSMWFYSLKVVPLEPDNYQVTYQAGKYTHQINIQVAYRDGRYWINAITGVR